MDDSSLAIGHLLHSAAVTARILGCFDKAENYIDRAIAISENFGDLDLLSRSLNESGIIAYNLSDFNLALEQYQQALELSLNIENLSITAKILDDIGVVYRRQGQYETALDFHQQALNLVQSDSAYLSALKDRILNNIGIIYTLYGDYSESIRYNLQALSMSQETNDRLVEARILSSIGTTYINIGDYTQAQEFLRNALAVAQDLGNQAELGRILINLGLIEINRGNYQAALERLEAALDVHQSIGNLIDEASSLVSLGSAHWNLGNYATALEYCQEALEIQQDIGDRRGEAYSLSRLATVNFSIGNYVESLSFFQQSLQIFQALGARSEEAGILNSIGGLHYALGQFDQALDYYQQALTIRQDIGDRPGMGGTLYNIALIHNIQGNASEAITAFERSLELRRDIGDRAGEAATLNGIGALSIDIGNFSEAVSASQQSLDIYRDIGNPIGEASALTNLGVSYSALSQPEQALEAFQLALGLFQESGNRDGERFILSRLGDMFAQQSEIELAIVFYKQAVNLTESIRQELRTLPFDVQQTYTDTVAATYRQLADLLLQEDRILEAQRVLDLLKVQELDDYLQGVERSAETESGIALRDEEQRLLDQFQERSNRVVALGRELRGLEQIDRLDRTSDQVARVRQLRQLQQDARQTFRNFFESDEIQMLIAQLRQITGAANLELEELNDLQNNLQALSQNAVILYPLVLDDRIELILVTANAPPIRRTFAIDRLTLNQAIANFRSALRTPSQTAIPQAQQLYDWLIRPIIDDLAQADAEVIIYAPDRQLRYIPLAALHDGNQWLVEQFQINNITAASLDDLDSQPFRGELSVLAAAFTEGQYQVQIGDRTLSFVGLTFAGREVENLVQLIPGTETRTNADFNVDIIYDMNDFNVIHLATHATFNPGPPENSFILFGDGSRATLTDIKDWTFPNVELVVLSACETAVGDVPLGNGEEILGFGYLMQLAGADAAIASLWQVSDGGTQVLMDAFYAALNNGYTKAEALQRAQIALITNNATILEGARGVEIESTNLQIGRSLSQGSDLAHPYYWAPFILIGNGL
ncbi:MAG: tetratricopeptide repeat protein [Elainellaceae cyanobacterium]